MAKKSKTSAKKSPASPKTRTSTTKPAAKTSAVRNSPVPKATKVATAAAAAPKIVTHEMIAHRAYAIWQSGHGGDQLHNWLMAERQLRGM